MRVPLLILGGVALALVAVSVMDPTSDADAQAATINVTTLDDLVAADGQCSLRKAVENVTDGAATHADCAAGQETNEIVIPAGTIILSGGALFVSGDVLIRGQGMNETVLRGDGARIFIIETDGLVTIEDLEIRDGYTDLDDDHFPGSGGGIYHATGELVLDGVRLIANESSHVGGGIASADGTLWINDSEILGNTSGAGGGGLESGSEGATHTSFISGTRFSQNTGVSGGAIGSRVGVLVIEGSSFVDNHAGAGGAISLSSGSLTLTGSLVNENTATTTGGGIRLGEGTTAILDGVTVDENEAVSGAGIALTSIGNPGLPPAQLTVTGSLFRFNEAAEHGGAFLVEAGDIVVEDTLFSQNQVGISGGTVWVLIDHGDHVDLTLRDVAVNVTSAPSGAGVAMHAQDGTGTLLVESSSFQQSLSSEFASIGIHNGIQGTIVNSMFSNSSGNVVRSLGPGTHLQITNSTFVGTPAVTSHLVQAIHDGAITLNNSALVGADDGACHEENGGTITGTGNADDDGTCPGAINVPTEIFLPAERIGSTWIHHPIPDAPLIGQADPAFCPEVDQRGRPRKQGACDIGAIEVYNVLFAPMKARDGFAE